MLTTPLHIAEVKNKWSCTSTVPMCLRGVDKDNFYFRATIRRRSSIIAVVTRLQTVTTNEFSSPGNVVRFFALSEWPNRFWNPIGLFNRAPAVYNYPLNAFHCRRWQLMEICLHIPHDFKVCKGTNLPSLLRPSTSRRYPEPFWSAWRKKNMKDTCSSDGINSFLKS
jgi:hypothetical protein